MNQLKIQNKKETEELINLVKRQWGGKIELDYTVLKNNDDRIFLASKDIFKVELDKLRINSLGVYFGEIIKNREIRLSIEGSQIVGPHATNNVVELDDKQARDWMRGMEIEMELSDRGFVILKHGKDYLGSGKSMGDKILNYVPKARRITSSD